MDNQFPDTTEQPTFKDSLIDLIQFVAVVLAVLLILRAFVVEPHRVLGHSMIPNFHDGDYIITNKLVTYSDSLKRGEVIILKYPLNTDVAFIKRVIGLPGDKVKVQGGQVYVNDKLLNEPYLPVNTPTSGGSKLPEGENFIIPNDSYFMMGDNRGGSSDSREWGPLPKKDVIGQALLRYWPPQNAKVIQIDEPSN